MHELGGVPCYKDERLPCSKVNAISLPKDDSVNREFWIDAKGEVWGYFDKIGLTYKVYLSTKAFDKMKNGDLKSKAN